MVTPLFYIMHACMLSHLSPVQLFVTQWSVACQAPLSIRFSRQEYWSGLPCPLQRIFSTKGQNCICFSADRFFATEPPESPNIYHTYHIFQG